MDFNAGLIICCRREDLRFTSRNGSVAFNNFRADTAEGLNAERKRCNVEKENVFLLTAENAALDSRADRDAFIRVDALAWLFAENFADCILHSRDPGRTADENDFIYIIAAKTSVLHSKFCWSHGALN